MSIVVIGDVLLDRDVAGTSTRDTPDSSAPVIDIDRDASRAGGAGLVAHLLAGDGQDVTLVTVLSDDGASHELRRQLCDVTIVAGPSHAPTPLKTRVFCDRMVIARLDEGCAPAPAPADTPDMLAAVEAADAIVVADYGRGMAANPALRTLVSRAAAHIPVVWDPHPRGAVPVEGVWAVTPNRDEALAMAGMGVANGRRAAAGAGRRLLRRWAARSVAVTLGAQGVWLQQGPDAHDGCAVATSPVDAADTCGAGDRFTAALTAALLAGADMIEAVREAVRISSSFLQEGGVAGLESTPASSRRAIGAPPDPIDVIRHVREAGGTVVATGGCFDLLHAGHLRTLRAARAKGDALIVCMNSDDSVRRLKGAARPLMAQDDRAELLLGLDCVDGVVVFDEDTPLRVLDRLRPDIWVKGGDYIAEVLPEHELVAAWGGAVETVPFHPGRSTTALVGALERATGSSITGQTN